MPEKLTWRNIEELGIRLHAEHPGVDPLSVRFTDLHEWVCELEEFDDDPSATNEKKLEAIQMAWYEETRNV